MHAGMPLEGGDQWVKSDQERPLCHGEKAGQGRGGLSSHGLGRKHFFSSQKRDSGSEPTPSPCSHEQRGPPGN